MRWEAAPLQGAWLIHPEPVADHRGFFARTWDQKLWAQKGLDARLAQVSISFNHRAGTLRGMHYQAAPYEEPKLVRCTQGAIFDVIVDLRPGSPTRCRWFSAELTAENHAMLYVPAGFAHGFQTLADQSEVLYQISELYRPDASRGVRWNDPAFGIRWPEHPSRLLSERDAGYPDFVP